MRLCDSCDAQFPDEVSHCIHCGRSLQPPGVRAARDVPDLSGLQLLASEHPAKIAALLDRLREAGIPFTLVTDGGTRSVNWHRGSSGWMATASVYVSPADRERAEPLHREFLQELIPHLAGMAPDSGSGSEACPGCGESLPGCAESCPSCGLTFPGE